MASKKPKGLTITRKKNKYIFSWKKGETYADGQRLIWGYTQVTKNGSKSTKTKWESSTVKLSASKSNYTVTIPSTYTDIANVYFKVRGKANNKEWSAWENETFKLDAPKPPTVTAEWDSQAQNKTTFNYTAKDEDHQPYDHIVYQSILVAQCPDNYKIESMWADASVGELGGTSGNIQKTDSSLVGSHARIIRMKTVGQGGSSAWRYAHHVYASPYAPENVKVTAEYNEAWQYTDITVTWSNTIIPMQAPIDKTTVEYTIGVPTADDGLPTGASWTEMTPLDPVTEGAWQGRIYSQVAADECLFVRVVNTHDNWTMYNVPVIAYRAKLTSPTISSVTPNSGTHTIQVVLALGTANPDGKAAITYRDPDTGVVGVLGIATVYGTYNVVVPAWADNPGNIGAYNFVGESALQTTKADGTKIYSVEPIVTSDMVWNGTPTAPTITAVRKDEETVTVSWNWPWADATNAEISWADRPDAWESTAQPQTYDVANFHAATWNIGDLEQGKTWYFRVRLFYGENDTNIYGEYSNTVSVNLSSAPDTPVITLSDNVVKREGSVTVSWVYTSTDGTRQSYAEIYERRVNGEEVYDYLLKTVTSGTSTEINVSDVWWWGEGYKANIAVKVFSESGQQSGFSNAETLTIAEPLTCTIAQDSLVYDEVPLNPETYTGDMVTITNEEGNIKLVTKSEVSLEPQQDLNGYDKPWSGGAGKNKADLPGATKASCTVSGDLAELTVTQTSNYGTLTFNLKGEANTAYTCSAKVKSTSTGGNALYSVGSGNYVQVSVGGTITAQLTTDANGESYFRLRPPSASGQSNSAVFTEVQIEKGTQKTSFAPYSNICPITGASDVDVTVRNKNLLKVTATSQTINGVVFTIDSNGVIDANGTASARIDLILNNGLRWEGGETYKVGGSIGGSASTWIIWVATHGTIASQMSMDGEGEFTQGSTAVNRVTLTIYGGVHVDHQKFYPMVRLASEGDSTFEPYNSTTTTTSLGTTVYGGSVDVVEGTGTEEYGVLVFDGTQNLATSGSAFRYYDTGIADGDFTSDPNVISSWLENKPNSAGVPSFGQSGSANNHNIYFYNATSISGVTDLASFKTYLSNNPLTVVYKKSTPTTLTLTPTTVNLIEGTNYVFSPQGGITVDTADAIESGYFLTEMPLDVTVTGAGNEGDTTMKIVRAENYAMERPDGKDYNGYEGDLIVARNQAGEDQMSIDLSDLVGRFDDGAKYRIIATTQDQFGQSAEATKDFVVRWSHQAVIATGTAVIDGDIAKITPTKPNGASDDDYVDIYRLSCDGPELLYTHATFGETVVDPYPTIGDTGGYRLVLVTKNGDYITENEIPSWIDVTAGLDTKYQYIDFDGNRLPLRYNVELDETKQKIFDVTHYLGGAVQGDFLEGTEGSGSVSGTIPYQLDPDDFITLRELMRYTGLCHVRTKIGSNYVANVQVGDGSSHSSPGGLHKASLTIQQVDNPELDGVLLTDWQVS